MMKSLPTTQSCFACGSTNAHGLRLRFETDGKIVRTQFVLSEKFTGFQKVIHGGIIATILDEVMVWACGVQARRLAYCAELTVRFIRPARPGVELAAEGELAVNRRDRLYQTRGRMLGADGRVIAEASGKYLPLDDSEMTAAMSDFTDSDFRELFLERPTEGS